MTLTSAAVETSPIYKHLVNQSVLQAQIITRAND